MRLFSVFLSASLATCALCQTAVAQTADCKSIADPASRLTCYDKGAPPVASSTAARPVARVAPTSKVDSAKYIDAISEEDAIMNARIKGICHGC